ncbi:thioredoxin family protein [Ferrimonas pelagia]|uniref:Thioredoxin domain-containing protein n=1 Tax=Ferrimonas pelagia TaxID=1177826 RepID=A0ABP9FEQ3_9GAMM
MKWGRNRWFLAFCALPLLVRAEWPDTAIEVHSVATWQQALAQAEGQPVLLDLYADWCASCQNIKQRVLPAPEVQQALTPFTFIYADLTAMSEDDQALFDHFGLLGLPALMLFDRAGEEIAPLRMNREVDVELLLKQLKLAKQHQG